MRPSKEEVGKGLDIFMDAYYKAGRRRMNKEEAIRAIRDNRETYLFKPGRSWLGEYRKQRVYARGLSYDLANIIRNSPEDDPIRIIHGFIYELDGIMRDSDSNVVIDFCQVMIEAAEDILEILE